MSSQRKGIWEAALQGMRGRCPNCGEGCLFRSYLKPVETCSACGEDWSAIRADDGPAWLAILLVGHVVVPVTVALTMKSNLSDLAIISSAIALTVVLTLSFLPVAKGIFMAAIWSLGAENS